MKDQNAVTEVSDLITPLARALTRKGYETLTPVQQAMSDPDLVGRDALVSAQTGSGKTVAFGIAMATTLLDGDENFGRAGAPKALIIAPTRELALQVMRELQWLYAETGARFGSCVGGMDARTERRTLDRGVHIVVGTPGRLRDHLTRGALDLSDCACVVLDEADEMLDLGFREDLEFILDEAPKTRRTLLFSATVSRPIAVLAKTYQHDAVRIETKGDTKQHSDIEYRALVVKPADRENAIINLLRYYEAQNALVFCATRAAVNHMTAKFNNRGMSVVALSGELSQNERTHALQSMRDGRARVCIATDVAARGIDLPGLDLVIHADLPQNKEALLHRSGRTGRAGSKGVSALIVPMSQRKKAERLLGWAKVTAKWDTPPTAKQVEERDNERLLAGFKVSDEVDQEFVAKLLAAHTPEQIAAAYITQYRDQRSAPEELQTVSVTGPDVRSPRDEFAESTWISLTIGRNQKAEPRWLLPMLCRAGDITKRDIGAIRMQPDETFVQLNAQIANDFMKALGGKKELEEGIKVTVLDTPPDLGPQPRGKPQGGKKRPYKRREGGDDRPAYKGKKEWDSDRDGGKPAYKGKGDRDGGKPAYKGKVDRDGGKPAYKGKKKWDSDDNDSPRTPYKGKSKWDTGGDKPAAKGKPKSAPKYDSKPRHKEAPKSDFAPKFGGEADATPKRKGGGKPRPKNLGANDRGGARKPRHKDSGKGKFAKPSGKKKTSKPMGKKRT
ncbi:DEAD/DEAH box helicase [Profundibacter amoris]|uniref:DEAD/DEAH box helicase n=1 Tax=Profundibacter amoris TaxID=2171755 RepID=UPI002681C26F|nr:DEAD/DEAH box helicase [Profundibacter amoris]